MFLMVKDISNNENTVAAKMIGKHNGFDHDIASIALGYSPIFKDPPPIMAYPTVFINIFQSPPIILVFRSLISPTKWKGDQPMDTLLLDLSLQIFMLYLFIIYLQQNS